MDFIKNYYSILGVKNDATEKEIKKAYYNLSKQYHPDLNKDIDSESIFKDICNAYKILINKESREEYDLRSKWGANYDESYELLNYEFNNNAKTWDEDKLEDWKKNNQLNVLVYIDDTFDGSVEYERWVTCKTCGGDGKDITSKISIKDENGNVLKMFEGADGCDFCEGTGKNWKNDDCYFCGGKGKVGMTECKSCKGEKRILGKQKLTKIKFPKGESAYKVEAMGHTSKTEKGKVGCVWLINKKDI
jgi:DnaJ-class molecular chaperone